MTIFDAPVKIRFENTVEKGENAGFQHVLLFAQCFLPYHREIAPFNKIA